MLGDAIAVAIARTRARAVPGTTTARKEVLVEQLVQVFGSLLVLAAFVSSQRGWLKTDALTYQCLNLIGSAVLAVLAATEKQLGFFILEFVWALVSANALFARWRKRRRR